MKLTTLQNSAASLAFGFFLSLGLAATSQSATVAEFNAAIIEANDLRKQARQLKHEWRDTAKILRKAQEAAQEGDLDKAMKLVAEAKNQSEAAIFQANREEKLWEARVIR